MSPAEPSPELFFETASAYQRTAALKAALELSLFTVIDGGAETAAAMARESGCSERGVRIVCDYLTIIGFLTKEGDRYGLRRATRAFLSRESPAYLGDAISFLTNPRLSQGFAKLAETVRRGTLEGGPDSLEPHNPMWVEFARGMAPVMAPVARQIGDLLEVESMAEGRVLDIAAGHGLFGIDLLERNPRLEVVAQDWPAVLEVARENAGKAGVADRYSLLAGDAFEVDFGSGYQMVLLTNFLHHFDPPACVGLLKKVHRALSAGGRAVVLELVPNPDRVSPPRAAAFSLVMLAMTPGGDAYTHRELDGMLREAGYLGSEVHSLEPGDQQVLIGQA